jgi:hypothetical protein
MRRAARSLLVSFLLLGFQSTLAWGQQRPPAIELKEMRDAVRDGLTKVDATLGKIHTRLDQVASQLSQAAARPSGMTTFEILLLLLTLAYSVGTFLLWGTTRDQVRLASESMALTRDGYEQAKKASIAAMLQQLGANDRSIKSLLVQDPTIYGPMEPRIDPFGGRERPIEERRLKAYIGLVINHVKHVFLQERLGQLPPNYWEAVDRDLDVSVQVPEFRDVWARLGRFQPLDFRAYVDEKMRKVEEERAKGGAR